MFLDYADVMELIGCSKTMSYKVIGECNKELKENGKIVFRGKVPTQFLLQRIGVSD